MEPSIPIERFAELSAELDAGASRDAVLAREGLSPDTWSDAQEAWLARIADDAMKKRFELTTRYNSAFSARRKLLEQTGVRAAVQAVQVPSESDPLPAVATGASAERSYEPSYEPSYAQPPGGMPSFVSSARAPYAESDYREPGLAASAGSSFAENASPAFALHDPATSDSTLTPARGLPFTQARTPDLPFFTARAPQSNDPEAEATTYVPQDDGARPVLPFAKNTGAPRTESTTAVDVPSPFANSSGGLPFRSAPPTPPASQPGLRSGLPFVAAQGVQDDPTASEAAPRVVGGALPFRPADDGQGASGEAGSRFTLEQFASLTAEIAETPARAGEVRSRYGLDDRSHRMEAEAWQRRFEADLHLSAHFADLVQRYRAWLRPR